MEKEQFEALVMTGIGELPPEFQSRLENVDVVLQDYPTLGQLARVALRYGRTLLGLYEGIPHTKRTSGYNMVLPDKNNHLLEAHRSCMWVR